jgi:hypothetical protein
MIYTTESRKVAVLRVGFGGFEVEVGFLIYIS